MNLKGKTYYHVSTDFPEKVDEARPRPEHRKTAVG